MKHYLEKSRIIKVNGEETHLLAWWVSDDGIVLEVSGPKSHLLHQVKVTEYDGSPFTQIETGKKREKKPRPRPQLFGLPAAFHTEE